jgi:transposase InsO family protein
MMFMWAIVVLPIVALVSAALVPQRFAVRLGAVGAIAFSFAVGLTGLLAPDRLAEQTASRHGVDYNTVRPHASLGQQTPAAYAAAACAGPKPGCAACSAAALASPGTVTISDGLSVSP